MYVGQATTIPSGEQIDWRRQLAGLFHLLEQDYVAVRAATRCYLELEHRAEEADPLVTLRGLAGLDPFGRRRAPEPPPVPPPPGPGAPGGVPVVP